MQLVAQEQSTIDTRTQVSGTCIASQEREVRLGVQRQGPYIDENRRDRKAMQRGVRGEDAREVERLAGGNCTPATIQGDYLAVVEQA